MKFANNSITLPHTTKTWHNIGFVLPIKLITMFTIKNLFTLSIISLFSVLGNAQTEMYHTDRVLSDSAASVRKTHKSIKINKSVWLIENLNTSTYRNGDSIPEAKTEREWKKCKEEQRGCWCYYQNDPENGYKFGKLYNWYAVNDPRGLAPKGWHIPTEAEWEGLINHLGGKMEAGSKLKSDNDWPANCNASNSSGFFGLPAGFRTSGGVFMSVNDYALWWTSSNYKDNMAWYVYLYCGLDFAVKNFYNKCDGFSVRCVKD
jgi:uncharacterized protein (TIGR02145 family)